MFDLAWSEIMLIGAVALVVIGPKELPNAIRTIAELVKKARTMAWEFRGHLDEVVREAKLDEVRDQFNDIRNFDLKETVAKTVDPKGDLRQTVDEASQSVQDMMKHDPLAPLTPHTAQATQTAHNDAATQLETAFGAGDPQDAADAYDTAMHTEAARSVTSEDIASEAPKVPDFVPPEIAAVVLSPRPAFVPPDVPRG